MLICSFLDIFSHSNRLAPWRGDCLTAKALVWFPSQPQTPCTSLARTYFPSQCCNTLLHALAIHVEHPLVGQGRGGSLHWETSLGWALAWCHPLPAMNFTMPQGLGLERDIWSVWVFFTDTEKARKADHLLAKSLVLPSSPSNVLTYTLTCKCWRHQVETELSSSTFMVNLCTRRPSPCSLSHHPKLWHGHVCCSEGEQPFTLPPASKQDRWQSCGRAWMSQHWGKDRSVPRKPSFSPVHLLGCASAWLWSRQRSLVGEQCWWGHFQLWLWAMWLWEMPSQLPKPAGEGKGAAMSLAGRRQVQEGEVSNAAWGGQPCRKDLCIQGMPRQTWANTTLWLGMSRNWELGYIRKSGLQLKLCLLQAGTELEWCPVVGPLLKRDVEEPEGVRWQACQGTQVVWEAAEGVGWFALAKRSQWVLHQQPAILERVAAERMKASSSQDCHTASRAATAMNCLGQPAHRGAGAHPGSLAHCYIKPWL